MPYKYKSDAKKYWIKYYKENKEQYARKRSLDHKIWYKKNRESKLLKRKLWGIKNKERRDIYSYNRYHSDKGIFDSVRTGAGSRNLSLCSRVEFESWYKNTPKVCVYCGLPIKYYFLDVKLMQRRGKRFSIDRKNNNLGYTVENICLSCLTCNLTKSDIFTYEEMLEIGKKYISEKWKQQLILSAIKEKLNEKI